MEFAPTQKPPLSPANWPCEQPHVLLVIEQAKHAAEQERRKKSTAIRDLDFQSGDEESVYSPSESEASEALDSEGCEYNQKESEPNDPMELDINDEEIKDLEREVEEQGWTSAPSPTPSEKERSKELKFKEDLQILEAAEREAVAIYNPDEVVKLLTELYELLVEMAHWPEGTIKYAPHLDPSLDVELAKKLGFDTKVIDLMQRLPCVEESTGEIGAIIFHDSHFSDFSRAYRNADDPKRWLKRWRQYPGYEQENVEEIESWMLPIIYPSNLEGWVAFLDTRLGVIRAYKTMDGPPTKSIEYRRHGPLEEDENGNIIYAPFMYRRAPLVPAAKYLKTLIECYRSLERIPIWEKHLIHEQYPRRASEWQEMVEDEYGAVVALYAQCGWPDLWDRVMFTERWEVFKVELRELRKEKARENGTPWIPKYPVR